MKIEALNNYCILELIETNGEVKVGYIVLPSIANVTPRWATVLSTGPGVPDAYGVLRKPDVKEGDTVYTMAHGQFAIQGSPAVATSILDIMAVLTDKEELQIQPLGSYIEIEKIERDAKNEFGIELPDKQKPMSNVGIVKTVGIGWYGPDGSPIPMQVKVGDKVVFNPTRTTVVDFTSLGVEKKSILIQHGDILGVVIE